MVDDFFLLNDVWSTSHSGEVGGEVEFYPDYWAGDFVDSGALFKDAAFLMEFISEVEVA